MPDLSFTRLAKSACSAASDLGLAKNNGIERIKKARMSVVNSRFFIYSSAIVSPAGEEVPLDPYCTIGQLSGYLAMKSAIFASITGFCSATAA